MDASVLHISSYTREQDLDLRPRPPEPAFGYGPRKDGKGQGPESVG